jgi:hypothetical protein
LPDVRQWRSIDAAVERWISVVETRSYQARAQKLLTQEEQNRVIEMIAVHFTRRIRGGVEEAFQEVTHE